MTKGNEGFSIGIGMIVGLVAGAITGVLFAPQSGEESRQKIKEVLICKKCLVLFTFS